MKNKSLFTLLAPMVIIGYLRQLKQEALYILASRLERILRNAADNSEILRFISGFYDNHTLTINGGNLRIDCNTANHLEGISPSLAPFYHSPQTQPCIVQYTMGLVGQGGQIVNSAPVFQTPFLYLRLCSSAQYGNVQSFYSDSGLTMTDIDRVKYLGLQLSISGNWNEVSENEIGAWRRAFIDPGMTNTLNCSERFASITADGVFSHWLEYFPAPYHMLLPTAYYHHPAFPCPLELFIPPEAPFHLVNEEKLSQFPDAVVVVTDEIGIAFENASNPEVVYCALPGGEDTIADWDIFPLTYRTVVWPLLDSLNLEADPDRKYRIGVKVATRLYEHNVKLKFIDYENFAWNRPVQNIFRGVYSGMKLISVEELVQTAVRRGIYIPEELRGNDILNIEGDELEKCKRAPLLLAPIIREGSGTVIFGGTGVAKSWLAMSICCAVANGVSVFPDLWMSTRGKGAKCLTIAGEMNCGEYGERLKRLNEHYAVDDAHKKNFILEEGGQLDLASESGLKRLHAIVDDATHHRGVPGEPVALVVLDNLTTLSSEGENPSNFSNVEFALRSLKTRGIAVVLIHHENKQGDIRGARKISDVMDMKLHLFRAESDDDRIGIIVKNEKIRSGKRSAFSTFKAFLDVEASETGWMLEELTPEELVSLGEIDEDEEEKIPPITKKKVAKTKYKQKAWKLMSTEERIAAIRSEATEGLTSEQIAANHATSRSVITEFRKKHQLRDCDLKSQE